MRRLLILISADPLLSARPAEAIRLAAGLSACQQMSVTVYLHGPAVKTLAPDAFDMMDSDVMRENWHLAATESSPAWVQAGMLQQHPMADWQAPCREILPDELATRLLEFEIAIHFDGLPDGQTPNWNLVAEICPAAIKMQRPLVLSPAKAGTVPAVAFDLNEPTLDYERLLQDIFQREKAATL